MFQRVSNKRSSFATNSFILYYQHIYFSHAEDVVKLFSPVLFVDFVVGLSMMCTTVFQLAVVIILMQIRY
jgi:hypothetical protein